MNVPAGSVPQGLVAASVGDTRVVAAWLASKDWSKSSLVNWLQGDDIPAIGHSQEPFAWVLEGLEWCDEPGRGEEELARRARLLLEDHPDEILASGRRPSSFRRPEQYVSNLLYLCSGLSQPEHLAEPLLALFRRGKLPASQNGHDFKTPLRLALIQNQPGPDLRDEWFGLLEGRESALGGRPYEGYRGVLLMPRIPGELGQPWLDAIGEALRLMALHIERFGDRHRRMRKFIGEVYRTYFGRPGLAAELLRQAIRCDWPRWAAECLPSLYLSLGTNDSGDQVVDVWSYVVDCIPPGYRYSVRESYLNECISRVELSRPASLFVRIVAPLFEKNRLENPFSSVSAMVGVVGETMLYFEEVAESQGETDVASAFREARRLLLQRLYKIAVENHPDQKTELEHDIKALNQGNPDERGYEAVLTWAAELKGRGARGVTPVSVASGKNEFIRTVQQAWDTWAKDSLQAIQREPA